MERFPQFVALVDHALPDFDQPRYFAPKSRCDDWHTPECQFFKSESGCKFGDECSFAHWKLESQSCKKPKKDGDKSAVAILKNIRHLGCVFRTKPPKSSSKHESLGINSTSAIHKSYAASRKHPRKRRTVVRKNLRQKFLCPYALKFQDKSQERLKDKSDVLADTRGNCHEWCFPAPSVIKPEERELVVDSGASTHMSSRKDLNSAGLETGRVSKSPTTVVPERAAFVEKSEQPFMWNQLIVHNKGLDAARVRASINTSPCSLPSPWCTSCTVPSSSCQIYVEADPQWQNRLRAFHCTSPPERNEIKRSDPVNCLGQHQ